MTRSLEVKIQVSRLSQMGKALGDHADEPISDLRACHSLSHRLTSTTTIQRMSKRFAVFIATFASKVVNGLVAVQHRGSDPVARASIVSLSFSPSTTPYLSNVSVLGVSMVPLTTVTQTTTVYPTSQTSISSESALSSSNNSHGHQGAIAGGVVAAIVIAAIAALLIVRFRNKRSPRHWRNLALEGQLRNLERKSPSGSNSVAPSAANLGRPHIYDGANGTVLPAVADHTADPFVDNVVSTTKPLAPLILHDKHRPSAGDPFADPHTSPGGASRGHHPSQSSLGSFGRQKRYHSDEAFIEMDMSPSSPTREKFRSS